MKNNRYFDSLILCVTDMIKNGSFIFFDTNSRDIVSDALNKIDIEEGYFFSKCLSRKKQLIPLIMNVIK
jgi:inorganic pyrophosphatase/exopolyphosphatase